MDRAAHNVVFELAAAAELLFTSCSMGFGSCFGGGGLQVLGEQLQLYWQCHCLTVTVIDALAGD